MYSRRHFIGTVAAGLGAGVVSLRAFAQASVKQVTITVGSPAGGSADVQARLIADGLRRNHYAPTVVVENRPGAGSRIGVEYVKNAKNDGSALLFTPAFAIVLTPHLYKNLPYDGLRDFVPVGICSRSYGYVFSIGPAVPASVKTLADFVRWCKENPKRAVFGAPPGSSQHLSGAMFARAAGITLDLVPYKGGAPQVQDLVGGHIPMSINPILEPLPHIQQGKLRALATTGSTRSPSLHEVPTMTELGYKDVLIADWIGMLAPAGTPFAVVTKLNAAMAEVTKSAEVVETFARLGLLREAVTPERFAEMVKADYARYGAIVRATGFKVEE